MSASERLHTKWSNGMMGLKDFLIILMSYFRSYSQYSSPDKAGIFDIPTFHSLIPAI
jgi:hypothetical protein